MHGWLKHILGRREWVRESDLKWDSWEAWSSKKFVRREECMMKAGQCLKGWI